ncbi:MAG: RsbRD N-terminal domain-containing protein, partial [Candidatus Zixiibacteriota bacterium]
MAKKTTTKKKAPAAKASTARLGNIIKKHHTEIARTWRTHINALLKDKAFELLEEDELRRQTDDLLQLLADTLSSAKSMDIESPEFGDLVALVRDLSVAHAESGLSFEETASIVVSLGSAVCDLIIAKYASDLPYMKATVSNMLRETERLSLIAYETY